MGEVVYRWSFIFFNNFVEATSYPTLRSFGCCWTLKLHALQPSIQSWTLSFVLQWADFELSQSMHLWPIWMPSRGIIFLPKTTNTRIDSLLECDGFGVFGFQNMRMQVSCLFWNQCTKEIRNLMNMPSDVCISQELILKNL